MQYPKKVFGIIAGTLLLLSAVLIYTFGFPQLDRDATILSAIVLIGLALTVVFMAILGIIYSVMGVENKDQPLGLPEGSVRALLAFSLVLIFVCLAAFLFSEVNGKVCDKCTGSVAIVNDAQLNDLRNNYLVVSVEPAKDEKGNPQYEKMAAPNAQPGGAPSAQPGSAPGAQPGGPPRGPANPGQGGGGGGGMVDDTKHPLYKATYYPRPSKDAIDFAKQIFTTLASVFISVVSFYFGSSVTSSAVNAGAKAAQATDGDKKTAALQTALTNALADSHNAQLAVDRASANLSNLQKSGASAADITAAQKTLDDAQNDLKQKQAKVEAAHKAVNDAKTQAASGA